MTNFFNNKTFADPWFDSKNIEFNNINIAQLPNIEHNRLTSRVERWRYKGSDWTINSILQHQLVILETAPCEGNSYFPLPKELNNAMNELINIQNEHNECFRSCLVRYLNPVNKNPSKVINIDKEIAKQLIFKDAKFPVH